MGRFVFLLFSLMPLTVPVAAEHFPNDAGLLEIIQTRVDEDRAVGIVVGVIEADGTRRVQAYGDPGPGRMPLSADSVFEIGSISKVFTGIALASMADDGLVAIDDAVQKHVREGVSIPARGSQVIRFVDIVTHHSGLPRMPSSFAPADPTNPYADYTVEMMYEFLAGHDLTRDVGDSFEYSNLGMGLLGQVLAEVAGTDYETLVRARILDPLGMDNTAIALTDPMAARMAHGHTATGMPTSNWDFPALAGAGALRSDVNDMLDFIAANIRAAQGKASSDVERAMATSHGERATANGMGIGLAWVIRPTTAGSIVWHNGGTGGFRTWAGFDPDKGVGAVVLTNSGHGADDIGFHLIDPSLPLAPPPEPMVERTEIEVPRSVMARYVGVYELVPTFRITVELHDDGLRLQATDQPQFHIFAESQSKFFLKVVEAQVEFVEQDGEIDALILHQGGAAQRARKIE